mmetsp:Transcript_49536/g.67447  ORF Transcript_49536/g.67447 Transcript_49536/m.67447 type:complete len:134 (-) Transcript_49536:1675-2076(-)
MEKAPTLLVLVRRPSKRVRYQWTGEKKMALLTQIVATGKNAFMTAKGSKAVDDFVSQLDVWTNAETGIIPLLNMHAPEFKDNPITSTHTSIITSVIKIFSNRQLGRCWSEVFSSVKVQVKVSVQELQVQVKTR